MRFKVIPLEKRIVLDAEIPEAIEESGILDGMDDFQDSGPVGEEGEVRVLLISSSVENDSTRYQEVNQLKNAAEAAGTKVVLYTHDSSLESIQNSILEALGTQKADSIAFASHGGNGYFSLSESANLTVDNLQSDTLSNFFISISNLLQTDGRIDLLGCNLIQESSAILDVLENLTGKNFAGSDDLTGSELLGGDWYLESDNIDLDGLYFNSTLLSGWEGLLVVPVFTGDITENISEDGAATASGDVDHTDADAEDTDDLFQAVTAATPSNNGYGTYEVTAEGVWTYTLDNTNATVNELDASETLEDTLTVTAGDGTTQTVTITITGGDDTSVATSSIDTDTTATEIENDIIVKGNFTITDVDGDDNPSFSDVTSITSDNSYGTFDMTSQAWTYTILDSDKWSPGDTLEDATTFTATDDTTHTVSVRINWLVETEITVLDSISKPISTSYFHYQEEETDIEFNFVNTELNSTKSLEFIRITIEATGGDLPETIMFGASEVALTISDAQGRAEVPTEVLIENADGSFSVPMQLPYGMIPDEYVVSLLLVIKEGSVGNDIYVDTVLMTKELIVVVPHPEVIDSGFNEVPQRFEHTSTEVISTDTLDQRKR